MMTVTPLQPWVGIDKSGAILCTHCHCVAGAGEACSHVAALLYAIMAGVKLQQQNFCTSVQCQWLTPPLQSRYVGASPDGVIVCDCYGMGCLEVKCPYCSKDGSPESANFLDDDSRLKKNHEYFYKVQAQI